tara:strand:+ start:8006 stop:8755 length:750 start_codon:yes stop_codon:yes gene_type:complete
MNCEWKDASTCLKIFKAIQHTNTMVNIDFSPDGMHIMSMDTSKTSLVKLQLQKGFFETYTSDACYTVGIYTETLCNILQKVKKNKLYWKSTDNVLKISCQYGDQNTEFSLRAIEIEEDQLDIPELEDDVSFRMNPVSIKDICDRLLMGKTDVHINISQTTLQMDSTSTEFGTITHTEPIGGNRIIPNNFKQNVEILLSFHAIRSMFIFSTCGENECFLGFSAEMPSRLKVHLGMDSYLSLYVAPKIIND